LKDFGKLLNNEMNGIQITTNNNYKQNFKYNLLVIFYRSIIIRSIPHSWY